MRPRKRTPARRSQRHDRPRHGLAPLAPRRHMTEIACPCGCGRWFQPGGRRRRVKKWATTACKHRIESACRRWAMTLFEAGMIGPETLAPYLPGAKPASGPRAVQGLAQGARSAPRRPNRQRPPAARNPA